jgi:hypothetical protein
VPTQDKVAPPAGTRWAHGAEPLALCMSCNATFPPDTAECPSCHVALSLVRKCPSCERTQSALHLACIYCANSFLQEEGLSPLAQGMVARRRKRAWSPSLVALVGAMAMGVAAGLTLYLVRRAQRAPLVPVAKSYVLHSTSMRLKPSSDAPPVKDLAPAAIVNITGYQIDGMGNRWFRIAADDVGGFVSTQDVAPPKALDSEKGFEVLRQSLLGLANPALLSEAGEAVEYYRRVFVGSRHADEASWLLAEKARELADSSSQPGVVLASARQQYEIVAQGGGEFAVRAREALTLLAEQEGKLPLRPPSRSRASAPLQFSVVGGVSTPSRPAPAGVPVPVRRLTVLSRTPLIVRLPTPVELSAGRVVRGYIAQDVLVNKEVAIPAGSAAHLTVTGAPGTSGRPSLGLQFMDLVIERDIYRVDARMAGIHVAGRNLTGGFLPSRLDAGTLIEFRLTNALVVTRP